MAKHETSNGKLSFYEQWSVVLTAKPHDKLIFPANFCFSKKIQNVGQWENVQSSANKNQHLQNKANNTRTVNKENPSLEGHGSLYIILMVIGNIPFNSRPDQIDIEIYLTEISNSVLKLWGISFQEVVKAV